MSELSQEEAYERMFGTSPPLADPIVPTISTPTSETDDEMNRLMFAPGVNRPLAAGMPLRDDSVDPELLESARRGLAKFGDDAMRAALDATGLGNSRHLIRAFAKLDKDS